MRYFFPALLLVINIGSGIAQNTGGKPGLTGPGDYLVKQYNSENGLPQNSAKDLLLDQKKFLWIATEDGLVRFDGQRFRVYNTTNTPILKSNRFSIISETPQHEVLLGSSYDRNEIYKATFEISIDTVNTRLRHKSISNRSNGVFDFTNLYRYYSTHKDPLVDTVLLNALCESQSIEMLNADEIVVEYKNRIYYANNITAAVVELPVNRERRFSNTFFVGDVFCFPGENGKLSFFKQGKEIDLAVDKSVTDLFAGLGARPAAAEFQIFVKGDLVLIRRYKDIYRVSLSDNVLKAERLFNDLPFLDKQLVSALQYDKNAHRLFVGTFNAGLFVVTRRVFNTLLFNSPDLNDNVFMAFSRLPGGRILTSNGIFDQAGAGRNVLFGEEKPDRICIYTAADQSIWLSKNGILNRYDSSYSRTGTDKGVDLGAVATCIVEDHAHTIWASTAYSLFEIKEGKPQFGVELFPRIEGRSIESITEAEPGMLWIATRKGLYAFDIARKRMNDKPLLADVYARSIFRAKDGSIWVGTYGNGYYKYTHGAFVALPLDPQKYLANTHVFLEDDNGFFWITTNHGLFKLRKADLDSFVVSKDTKDVYFYYFDKSYGFNTNEFNGGCNPAALKDGAGNFYFPSLSGIVYFNPARVPTELPVNDIYIDRFHVGAQDLDYTKPIIIKPDFDQVFVDVATPFFGLNDNLNLVYKLNAIGQKWYPVNADGRIVINRLPYGKYSLIIRKREGWGREKFTTANISFEVLPYWYNTGWFYGSLGVLVLLLGFGLFKIRTRILLRQNLRLQEKVDERTYELNQSTIMKEKLISVIVHDLRSPLASHSFLVDYLYDHLGKISVNTMEELFFQLKESSDRISHFSRDFLTWYNSQKQGWKIKRTAVVLDEFLVQVVSFYKEMALRKNIGFECEVAPGLVLQTDEYILSIVVRNLVDNAVKYTRSGGIRVLAFREKDTVHIQVKDTGQGMPASRVDELMEYVNIDTNKAKPTFGYLFIQEFTRKLGGKIVIESEPENGTTVTVMLGSL